LLGFGGLLAGMLALEGSVEVINQLLHFVLLHLRQRGIPYNPTIANLIRANNTHTTPSRSVKSSIFLVATRPRNWLCQKHRVGVSYASKKKKKTKQKT
jgi:hypothetical protein